MKKGWIVGIVVLIVASMVGSLLIPASAPRSDGSSIPSTHAAGAAAPIVGAIPGAPPATTAESDGPHPGAIDTYEIAADGATTEDPALAYDTVSAEPILNVYQTLVAYNGNSTATFMPQLSTCVPGTNSCTALYGSDLLVNNAQGLPEFYTYPIDPNAHFYDPSTKASWSVYPSDVMFSIARTESFSEAGGVGLTNGWIETQALAPNGNYSWDGGLHYPYNNTPQSVLSAMLINDSTYCPASTLAQSGCVTFDVNGGGQDWPFFNQLVADPLGASVEPCGWFTAQDAGLPGFTGTSVPNGDGPCLLPGGAHSTSDASFQAFLESTPATVWDATQLLSLNFPAVQPSVQWNAVGSGPYYLVAIEGQVGYVLQANPAYYAPTGCAGQPGCEPEPASYQPTVNVFWEESDQAGIQEYEAGQADFATIETTHTSTLIQLQQAGKLDYLNQSTLSIFFLPFNLNFSVSEAQALDTAGTINIPSDFFDAIGVRNFLTNAYPYATIQSTVNTVDGIEFGFNYGGAIPQFLGNYYPTNISWPSGDPVTDPSIVGSAAWWWAPATNASSPYYDAELVACTATTPCTFPIVGQVGAPNLDEMIADFSSEIAFITGYRLVAHSYDLPFSELVDQGFQPPGAGPLPFWNLAWAPDYADPTDYVAALYLPLGTFGGVDAWASQMTLPQYNAAACPDQTASWVDLVYWANVGQIPNDCQGIAYTTMVTWLENAAPLAPGNQRILEYNLAEHVADELAMYVYQYQSSGVTTYAPWINPATINTNVMVGGAGENTWYTIGYASAELPTYAVTFTEGGLPGGTVWSVILNGESRNSSGSTITFTEPNGTYAYEIGETPGWIASSSSGSVTMDGAAVSISEAWTQVAYGVSFTELGLPAGTSWSITLDGSVRGSTGPDVGFAEPNGTYIYRIGGVPGWATSNYSGLVTVNGAATGLTSTWTQVTYAVTFTETGLPTGASWSVTLNGVASNSTGPTIGLAEPNGTYTYSFADVSGWHQGTLPYSGVVAVNGSALTEPTLVFAPVAYSVMLTETGLPSGTEWFVNTTGGASLSSVTDTISLPEPNGTYPFTIATRASYAPSSSGGNAVVAGSAVSISITFTIAYPTTFDRPSGTPTGASWTVYVNSTLTSSRTDGAQIALDGIVRNTTSSTLAIPLSNGTYGYSIVVPGQPSLTTRGNVTVQGSATVANPPSTSSTFLGFSGSTGYYVLAAIIALVVVVAIVIGSRRRRRPPHVGAPPAPNS